MAIVKCDEPMARHKRQISRLAEGWHCNHDCQNCICALKKQEDGTWEHIQVTKNGEAKQKMGRKKSK